jgi:hypothetical protein
MVLSGRVGASFTAVTVIAIVSVSVAAELSVDNTVRVSPPL